MIWYSGKTTTRELILSSTIYYYRLFVYTSYEWKCPHFPSQTNFSDAMQLHIENLWQILSPPSKFTLFGYPSPSHNYIYDLWLSPNDSYFICGTQAYWLLQANYTGFWYLVNLTNLFSLLSFPQFYFFFELSLKQSPILSGSPCFHYRKEDVQYITGLQWVIFIPG